MGHAVHAALSLPVHPNGQIHGVVNGVLVDNVDDPDGHEVQEAAPAAERVPIGHEIHVRPAEPT
jgi:hypothetical protein